MAGRRKFIIDCDAGLDDAQAIMMAFSQEDIDVIAITTCHGNTSLENVNVNVLRVLNVIGKTQVMVYSGCDKSLMGTRGSASDYHGNDGLGDAPDSSSPDISTIQSKHAVQAMAELVLKYPGEVTLICLAPLTNVAMAIRLYPAFASALKECYIMGGSYEGKGNITPSAEFNFHTDPEAADIVFAEMACPITLACWEHCLKYSFSWDWYRTMIGGESKESQFIKKIEATTVSNMLNNSESKYITADQLIMASAINPGLSKSTEVICKVELHGNHTRGHLSIDWKCCHYKRRKINLITEVNHDLYGDMLMKTFNK